MAKAKALQKKMRIPLISENFARLLHFLEEKYKCKRIEDKGEYVVGHCRIGLQEDQEIDVVAFTSDTLLIRASPKTPSELFHTVCSAVEKLAGQATTSVSAARPLTTQRAKTILDYASKLDLHNEIQRMVIVILCDTVNEIILREQMKALEIQGPPLDEGIPEKIERIEGKGQVVYRSAQVKNIRELRNGIVHQGNIPDKSQAEKCLEVTSDFLVHI
jgi:hypothetical protein